MTITSSDDNNELEVKIGKQTFPFLFFSSILFIIILFYLLFFLARNFYGGR